MSDDRAFGPRMVPAHGEARWHAADGEFAYVRFEPQQIEYKVLQR